MTKLDQYLKSYGTTSLHILVRRQIPSECEGKEEKELLAISAELAEALVEYMMGRE